MSERLGNKWSLVYMYMYPQTQPLLYDIVKLGFYGAGYLRPVITRYRQSSRL